MLRVLLCTVNGRQCMVCGCGHARKACVQCHLLRSQRLQVDLTILHACARPPQHTSKMTARSRVHRAVALHRECSIPTSGCMKQQEQRTMHSKLREASLAARHGWPQSTFAAGSTVLVQRRTVPLTKSYCISIWRLSRSDAQSTCNATHTRSLAHYCTLSHAVDNGQVPLAAKRDVGAAPLTPRQYESACAAAFVNFARVAAVATRHPELAAVAARRAWAHQRGLPSWPPCVAPSAASCKKDPRKTTEHLAERSTARGHVVPRAAMSRTATADHCCQMGSHELLVRHPKCASPP